MKKSLFNLLAVLGIVAIWVSSVLEARQARAQELPGVLNGSSLAAPRTP